MAFHGLIPAAGQGIRAYPATKRIPKVLLEIAGKPLIVRNIEIMRDQLGIRDITIIVGYLDDQVRADLGAAVAACGVHHTRNKRQILKNYGVKSSMTAAPGWKRSRPRPMTRCSA